MLETIDKILIVEDYIHAHQLIKFYMKEFQIELFSVYDGNEAVELVRSQKFSLILMDIQMPLMNGFEATRIIRAMGNNTPIMAITSEESYRSKCFKLGMNAFLTKPVDKKPLLEKIGNFIQMRPRVLDPIAY